MAKTENTDLQLLSAKALAQLLSISVRTVWRLREDGYLPPSVKIGNSTRWKRTDILRWLELDCPHEIKFERMKASLSQ